MVWTNDNVLEFIELYKRERLLWDPKHLQHKNRREVAAAWLRIQSRMNIHLSIIDLKKKKESLMTSLRFHWNKKKKDPTYHTSWFAYAPMDAFLCSRYEGDSINELDTEFFNNNQTYTPSHQTSVDPSLCRNTCSVEKHNTTITRQQRKSYTSKNNFRSVTEHSPVHIRETNEDTQKFDEYELYGQLLAKKLRKLDEHQRDMAMHDIDNIMFRAKMQSQTSQTRIYSPSTSPVPRKMKSPIYIVTTQQNNAQYEDESISYQDHNNMPTTDISS